VTYPTLGTKADGFSATSGQSPILARPFYNVGLHNQDPFLVI